MERARARAGAERLAGVDGVLGTLLDEMERRGVPIYTVPIGLPAPPDAMIAEVIAPEAMFRGDPVTLRVRLHPVSPTRW